MQQDSVPTAHDRRWLVLAFLALALVLSMSTWFSASAILPQLRTVWDVSPTVFAWLTIAVQIGFVIGAVISSLFNMADIVSPRHVIMGGAIGAALANLLLLFAQGPELGIPLRLATGFFLAGVYPPAFKLISTWFRANRGLALGILAAAIVVGNGIPHLINGLGGLDWQVVIVATSIQALIGGMIAEFVVREGPYPFPVAVFDPRQIGQALTNRGVSLATLGYVGHMWELFAMYAWILGFCFSGARSFAGYIGDALSEILAGSCPDRWRQGLTGYQDANQGRCFSANTWVTKSRACRRETEKGLCPILG